MSEIILPTIEHATVTLNTRNRVVIQMDEGWVFFDTYDYKDYVDDEGNPRKPLPDEISYYKYAVYAPMTDFISRICVTDENGIPINNEVDETGLKAQAYDILMGVTE